MSESSFRQTGAGFSVIVLAVLSGFLHAQQPPGPTLPTPRLLYVFPSGGQVGREVTITATGQDLDDAKELHFSFPGVKVEALGPTTGPKADPKAMQGKKPLPPAVSFKFKVTLPA